MVSYNDPWANPLSLMEKRFHVHIFGWITPQKSNMSIPKMMGLGKCISGFKHGVILDIYVRFQGGISILYYYLEVHNPFESVIWPGHEKKEIPFDDGEHVML